MPDVSAADQVAVVDAAIQAAELGLASLASVADKAPLLAPGAKRSETREADTREEAEIKQSTKVYPTPNMQERMHTAWVHVAALNILFWGANMFVFTHCV